VPPPGTPDCPSPSATPSATPTATETPSPIYSLPPLLPGEEHPVAGISFGIR
jgi:hypothetical protein